MTPLASVLTNYRTYFRYEGTYVEELSRTQQPQFCTIRNPPMGPGILCPIS